VTVPRDPRREAGRRAEDAACRRLESLGLVVLERNVRAGGGEIDVVARDGQTIVFVEVRFRESGAFGSPEESVGPAKRSRIVRAAAGYLGRIGPSGWREARFDVVAVEGGGEAPVIRHFPAAFDARGKVL
jgi:putative endonuclease